MHITKYREVYKNNRKVFHDWGYRMEDGEFVSLGDRAAFLAATKVCIVNPSLTRQRSIRMESLRRIASMPTVLKWRMV